MTATIARRAALVAVGFLAALAAGCGGETKSTVSGSVKLDGNPVPAGRVAFLSQEGSQQVLTAEIKNGEYTLSGVPVGKAAVTVIGAQSRVDRVPNMPANMQPPGSAGEGPSAPGPARGPNVVIPTRYGSPESSGLVCDVKSGETPFDINLTARK
jgi:hypothetical protein